VGGLTRSASLSSFDEVARTAALDPTALLREFDLPQRCLTEPELRIPVDSVRRLLEAAADRSGVEAFGLRLAHARRLSDLGPLGLLMREQPTLRLALEACANYANRLNAALHFTIEESSNVVILREDLILGRPGPIRQSAELAVGVVFRALRTFMGPQWRPLSVCFSHDAPADRAEHDRFFGCRVEFGHAFNGIVCARRDLEVANPNADPGLARLARKMLDTYPEQDADNITRQVQRLVVSLLGTGACSIDVVAQHLGVDRRTVHRRLAQGGETFSNIVAGVRRELAIAFLKDPNRNLAEVSSLLGFSSLSGFSRWHRQQFGKTPSAQRTAVRRAPADRSVRARNRPR
jgi:AraC-like DNA-binding protein